MKNEPYYKIIMTDPTFYAPVIIKYWTEARCLDEFGQDKFFDQILEKKMLNNYSYKYYRSRI